MTSMERVMALFMRQPIDHIPFAPIAMGFYGINVGYSIYDYYYDMQKAFDAYEKTTEQYNFMPFPTGGYGGIGPWELGGEIKWPESEFEQCPSTLRLPVETEDDVWNLKIPDPDVLKTVGYMPRYIEFGNIAVKKGSPFALAMYGPWTTAGNIVGIEQLCRWTLKKADLAHHILRLATDFLLAVNQCLIDIFGAGVYMAGDSTPSAANNIISPQQFEQFALPYIKEYHEKLLAMGFPNVALHICGEQNLNYPYYTQVPLGNPAMVSVSQEVDLETAIEYFPDAIIMGNIAPAVIQTGTSEQVYELARICIEKGKKAPRGFILAPGCELPPFSPPYNVWTIMKAINDFGWYE